MIEVSAADQYVTVSGSTTLPEVYAALPAGLYPPFPPLDLPGGVGDLVTRGGFGQTFFFGAEVLGLTLELRVGLAVGDVIRVNVGGAPTCYGLPVNLARRLASAAAPGETLTCPALPVYAPGVALGEREVSNLSGFEELGVVRRVLDTPALPGLGAASAGMKTG